MNFDSIPFEEPDLFRPRNGPDPKPSLADGQGGSLDLSLDSQDGHGNSPAEVRFLLQAPVAALVAFMHR